VLNAYREGSGPPLVLLPGLGSTLAEFRTVLPVLTQRYDVLALDLPGFGSAAPLPGRPTIPALADAVETELDRVDLARPAVAGNSMGGSVGLELARRGRAEQVIVLGPSGAETPPERIGVIALNEALRAASAAAVPGARLVASNPAPRTALLGFLHGRPWQLPAEAAAAEIRDFAQAPAFHAALRAVTGVWRRRPLGDVDVPVRVCLGSRDLVIGAVSAPRMVAAIRDAELVPLPGCGHVPMSDDPQLVARAMTARTR